MGTVNKYVPQHPVMVSSQKHNRRRWFLWIPLIAILVLLVVGEVVLRRAAPILKGRVIETLSTRFNSRVELDDLDVSLIRGLAVSGHGLRIFAPDDVVAAAVILSPGRPVRGLNDSKQLDPQRRAVLAKRIRERHSSVN